MPPAVHLLFELRSVNLSRHAGLVSFPGGAVEKGENPFQAARRELFEELGIAGDRVELLGELDTIEGMSGDRISPFVCRIQPGDRPALQSAEVAEVFTVPLELLLSRGFQSAQMIQELHPSPDFPVHLLPGGSFASRHSHSVLYLSYGRYLIWGLTAQIVEQLLELLR